MDSRLTLAELRDRLKSLQADVDETIRALDAVDEVPPAPTVTSRTQGRPRAEPVTMRDVGRAAGREAEALHLRVPQDVAIVGFDDIPEAQWSARG